MKTLTTCLIIAFVSGFGLYSEKIVSTIKARTILKIHLVEAEELYGFSNETIRERVVLRNGKEVDSLDEEIYIPHQFNFLKESEKEKLFYKILHNIILGKNNN